DVAQSQTPCPFSTANCERVPLPLRIRRPSRQCRRSGKLDLLALRALCAAQILLPSYLPSLLHATHSSSQFVLRPLGRFLRYFRSIGQTSIEFCSGGL